MFLLCTYADQDRWASSLEPLLYPVGLSFYRAFSYRKDYFLPEQLAEQLADHTQAEPLLKNANWNEGVFGIRFRQQTAPDFRHLFIPLRKITLDAVDRPDELNVWFRLGSFIAPVPLEDGSGKTMPTLDVSAVVGDIAQTKLFLQLREQEFAIAREWASSEAFPHDFWEAIGSSLSPLAKDRFRNAVVLRFDQLRARGKEAVISPVELDSQQNNWGYKLHEGATFDIKLNYKRLVDRGVEAPPVEHLFGLTNPADEIQAARRTVQIVGNYRSEELWICPTSAKPGPIMIAFEPSRIDAPNSVVDQTMSKMVGVKIPVLVIPKMWPTARIVNVIFAIACLLGFLASIRLYSASTPDAQKILLLIMTALASMFVTALKDVFIPKH